MEGILTPFTKRLVNCCDTKPFLKWILIKPKEKQRRENAGVDVVELKCLCTLGGKVNGAATKENSMVFPRKINIELQSDPAIPLLGICPKDLKAGSPCDICTPVFTTALFTKAKR